MESPLECVSRALREAVTQAREDSAKLPGPKGRMLARQAARWARALTRADELRPAPQPPSPDLLDLVGYLERRACEADAKDDDDEADRLRRWTMRVAHLSMAPRAKLPVDILDAGRLQAFAAELASDRRRALHRITDARTLDELRDALDGVPILWTDGTSPERVPTAIQSVAARPVRAGTTLNA